MRRLILRLAAATVLAASALVAAAPAAQAQNTSCSDARVAELEAQITTLTAQIEQSPTDMNLRDQRRIAQARLAACRHSTPPARFTGTFRIGNNSVATYTFSPSTVNQGADQDRFFADYDRALEQATEAAEASIVAHQGSYEAGFRVTQNITGSTGQDGLHCGIVMWVINYHDAVVPDGDLPQGWTSTRLLDGTYRTAGPTVGHC